MRNSVTRIRICTPGGVVHCTRSSGAPVDGSAGKWSKEPGLTNSQPEGTKPIDGHSRGSGCEESVPEAQA